MRLVEKTIAKRVLKISIVLMCALATSHRTILSQTSVADDAAISIRLNWREPPLDNPLRGLVPYASQMPQAPKSSHEAARTQFAKSMAKVFPHSVEFAYVPLAKLVKGERDFDWTTLEEILQQTSSRGCQCTFRVYMEYPGEPTAIPKYLIDDGLKVKRWKSDDGRIHTPDYEDPKLRKMMKNFISALGQKYDGDPRVAWLTVGMLGLWGEWHDYPKPKLFASKIVQEEVMDAYEAAFTKTKLHLRYPAGERNYQYASNANRNFGYHDDSFAWATIPTGKSDDDWFYGNLLEAAGPAAVEKWKTSPIGGEIRPETWGCVFEDPGCSPKGQEFDKCVQHTHVSWLMDSGMFLKPPSKKLIAMAKAKTAPMGYRLTVNSAALTSEAGAATVQIKVSNQGIAPFYHTWNIETALLSHDNKPVSRIPNDWKLNEVMPGATASWRLSLPDDVLELPRIGIRVPNPMRGGFPLRFGNEEQMLDDAHWLVLDFSRGNK